VKASTIGVGEWYDSDLVALNEECVAMIRANADDGNRSVFRGSFQIFLSGRKKKVIKSKF